mmetsp:Transcript_9813/g.16504  ORF Transcript_9813/g.16504 Transcript_9813/m.16504 type:complete len:367 (+) Transcript_9813:44-1144(+)
MSCPYHKKTNDDSKNESPKEVEKPVVVQTKPTEAKKCPYSSSSSKDNSSNKVEEKKVESTEKKCPYSSKNKELAESEAKAVAAAESGDVEATNKAMKEHFVKAYNQVADSVGDKKLDIAVSRILMEKLGYSQSQLDVIGKDVARMQGTGNPHMHADIQSGHIVVDLGSGFGVDAFLAADVVGNFGRVIGIDMSIGEISAAIERTAERKLFNTDFRLGDIEDIPVVDGSVDRVISNGGFCLVPDKRRAFREIFRVLKPGGKFSISCTVKRKQLDKEVHWPSCMHVFMPLDEIDDIIGGAGFVSIQVDDSNSSMKLWDEELAPKDAENEKREAKTGVHRGDPAYDHLKKFDMNTLCARVTVYAVKPEQ